MCSKEQYITLNETEEFQITYCRACHSFSVIYKSCCASFTLSEIGQFSQVLDSLTERDFCYAMMTDTFTIIKSPYSSTGFCLSRDDARSLYRAIKESLVLFEAFHIIYK